MARLAIITTHPIQYYSPWFKKLSTETNHEIKVFYTNSHKFEENYDEKFGSVIKWDIPILEGFNYEVLENKVENKWKACFFSIQNPDIIKLIKQWGPTHIMVIGWNYWSHLKVMMHFKNKIPVWFRGDSTLLDYNDDFRPFHIKRELKYALRKVFLTTVYKFIDKALYVGTYNKEYYLKYGVKEHQLSFVPHAIDNNRFSEDPIQKENEAMEWRRILGIKDHEYVILFCGKFEPRKNPVFFLNAFISFKKKQKNNTKLIFIGNGELEKELKEIADNITDVIFLPFQNQSKMPIIYRLGNLFCLPSKSETWGLAVNEALACGRPVLASNKTGCAIDLIKEENGAIFESNNTDDFIEKLTTVSNTSYDEEKIKKSIENWSFDEITNRINNLLSQ